MKQTINQIVQDTTNQLTEHYKSDRIANVNAWDLIVHLTDKDRTFFVTHPDFTLSTEQYEQLTVWVTQIVRDKKPIQYIIGTVPFLDLTIHVEPPTLIPRPETEEWCANLIEQIKATASPLDTTLRATRDERILPKNILDLCTGSGCIALSLAQAFPSCTIYATDIADTALELAQKNATANNITNVIFIKSDVFEAVPTDVKFDLIVSNPPYITPAEYKELEPTVAKWEDPGALVTEDEGLKIITQIIANAPRFLGYLEQGIPQLWVEIGYRQADVVSRIFADNGFEPMVIKDLYDNDRVVTGTVIKKT